MDAGRAVQFETPYELLMAGDTKVFYAMVMQSGHASYDNLLRTAQKVCLLFDMLIIYLDNLHNFNFRSLSVLRCKSISS